MVVSGSALLQDPVGCGRLLLAVADQDSLLLGLWGSPKGLGLRAVVPGLPVFFPFVRRAVLGLGVFGLWFLRGRWVLWSFSGWSSLFRSSSAFGWLGAPEGTRTPKTPRPAGVPAVLHEKKNSEPSPSVLSPNP